MKAQNIILIIVVIAIAGTGWWIYKNDKPVSINSFEECVAAGYPIMESYPEQCRTPEGQTFTRDIGNELDKSDLIRVTSPRPGDKVTSPLTIRGEARGTWYFEASFPVKIQTADGQVLAQAPAQAKGEWMTEDFVPFEVTLNFTAPADTQGKLILSKDNPSGLPENDDSLEIPITFSSNSGPITGGCVISGCSAQICGEEEMASTCEYRPIYECYKGAKCERNTAGQCAWVETPTLKACVTDNS